MIPSTPRGTASPFCFSPQGSRFEMIIGAVALKTGDHKGRSATELMIDALNCVCDNTKINKHELQGLFVNSPLASPSGFQASHVAQCAGILPTSDDRLIICKTIAAGGASGVTAVVDAYHTIRRGEVDIIAVVNSDATLSMDTMDMLYPDAVTMNRSMSVDLKDKTVIQPIIPNQYNTLAEWHMKTYGTTREQLAMVSVAMARQAQHHPLAMGYGKTLTLEQVLNSKPVFSVTSQFECSRRADGASAVIMVSPKFYKEYVKKNPNTPPPVNIIGVGEATGFLRPPNISEIRDDQLPLKKAAAIAYKESGKTVKDIDYFGLYDCFPVTLTSAVEHVGLAAQGEGGKFWEEVYKRNPGKEKPLNINTHGGLMHFGAPGSGTSLYTIVEAVQQMRGEALGLQVPNVKTALCYGNGGILTLGAVVILEVARKSKL